jgi:hypothetical protein
VPIPGKGNGVWCDWLLWSELCDICQTAGLFCVLLSRMHGQICGQHVVRSQRARWVILILILVPYSSTRAVATSVTSRSCTVTVTLL